MGDTDRRHFCRGDGPGTENLVVLTGGITHDAVPIIKPEDQSGFFPVLEPCGELVRLCAVQTIQHIISGKRCGSRRR